MAKAADQPLPGMEQREVEEIVQAAEKYRETRDERCRLSKQESEDKQALINTMTRHKRKYYSYRGLTVSLTEETNVKVQAKDNDAVEADASKRNTRRMVADIENVAKAKTPPTPEPTTEESIANAEAFFDNQEANAEVAELVAEAEASAAPDDFTAEMCNECRAIDGAHALGCSKSNGLTADDYLAYAKHNNIKSAASWARKWQLSREKDALILAWKEEGMEKRAERFAKPGPKKTKADKSKRANSQATR